MSEIIHGQVLYLLASTCCGMVCMFLYGFVRIFELFLKKNMILKIIIDVLFWMALSIPVFYIFYEINSGIIRWYGVFMLFAGMILYEKGIYTPAKKIIEKIIFQGLSSENGVRYSRCKAKNATFYYKMLHFFYFELTIIVLWILDILRVKVCHIVRAG